MTQTSQADKLAQLHEQIAGGVEALVESDAWRAMLDTAAKFHRYSLNNLLLIALQAPEATRVAGFGTWKSLGRQVRKGERGIAILAPCTYRPKKAKTDNPTSAQEPAGPAESGGTPEAAASGRPGGQVRGFRTAYVFDISQTDGEALPEITAPIAGQAPEGLWDGLAAQVAGHGYTLERGHCRGAEGYTDPTSRTVRVRADVDDAQAVLTLAHELAHIECGHVEDLPTYTTCRGRCEVEAESVAYVVAGAFGLDAGASTFGYVAGWAGGDATKVRQAAETVTKAARTILGHLEAASSTDQQPAEELAA